MLNILLLSTREAITLRFTENKHTLKLFKEADRYGDHNVVVSSSAWFEMEQTIKQMSTATM